MNTVAGPVSALLLMIFCWPAEERLMRNRLLQMTPSGLPGSERDRKVTVRLLAPTRRR